MSQILDSVRALRPRIREREVELTEQRRLPLDLVADLKVAGAFRLCMPKTWGGPELSPLEQIDVLEELSYANGSVGWCAMIGSDAGYYSAFLDDAAGRSVFNDLDGVTAGQAQPAANATKVDGGYRVSGRWRFGSGITHADVVCGGVFVVDDDGGFVLDDAGMPTWRTLILPLDEIEILDTWVTTGLEGSGSNDYTITDAFVPAEHAMHLLGPTRRDGPLYALGFLLVITKVAAVPLGIARRVIDEVLTLAPTKLAIPSFVLVRDEPRTHVAVARAEATVSSARAFMFDALGSLWSTLEAGDETTPRQRAMVRLAMQHAAHSCKEAVASLYDVVTTSAVYQPNPIDQALRDLTTICQHITLSTRNTEAAGRVLLGLEPGAPMF